MVPRRKANVLGVHCAVGIRKVHFGGDDRPPVNIPRNLAPPIRGREGENRRDTLLRWSCGSRGHDGSRGGGRGGVCSGRF